MINREAVLHVLRVGAAIGGRLADYTEFDRKNYFYPDLPKGYQLSQFAYPLVSGGSLNGVKVTRIHLEEDTARSQHDAKTGATLIDYNRAGVPLMELVTDPVIHSPEEAGNFAREFQLLLRYLKAGEANMEKGEMRVEANISVSRGEKLGTKVEVKNLNSFRSMERAIAFEVKRQSDILESGGAVSQETMGWDEVTQKTYPQRVKEGSADYRYFPDPDLPKLLRSNLPGQGDAEISSGFPELPAVRRSRYIDLGVSGDDANLYVSEGQFGDFYDRVVIALSGPGLAKLASNYVATDLVRLVRDIEKRDSEMIINSPVFSDNFAKLIKMAASAEVSSRGAKDTLALMVKEGGGDPATIAEREGLYQKGSEDEILTVVQKVIADNPSVVEQFKKGKTESLQFLLGQGMKVTRGSANPQVLRSILERELGR